MRGFTTRFLALIMAPLAVVAATAVVLWPGGDDDKIKVSADGPVVRITMPDRAAIVAPGPVEVVAKAIDDDGLATAEFRVDSKRIARVTLSGGSDELARFTWNA